MKEGWREQLLISVLAATAAALVGTLAMSWMSPTKISARVKRLLQNRPTLELNEHEMVIANEIIFPSDIDTGFSDVAGVEGVVQSIQEFVLYPLKYPRFFDSPSGLLTPPKGVLLYGPPGCGKTMLAKAIAKEAGASFINVKASTLTDKWYGESQKLTRALFTLAAKVQPCIIFIDEIDSFLRERRSSDHEVSAMLKAEFMALWDGLQTGQSTRIIVVGATNRPQDIDSAVLRRMPKRFRMDLPNANQRENILRLLLRSVATHGDFDFAQLSNDTEGFSGSDLKELCRAAAMLAVKEKLMQVRRFEQQGRAIDIDGQASSIRPLTNEDFLQCEYYVERTQYDGIMRQQQQQRQMMESIEELFRRS